MYSPCVKFNLFPSGKWEGHLEVKEMIELQRQGLVRRRSSNLLVAPGNNSEEEERERGWESGDEGQGSSEGEGEEGGKEEEEKDKEEQQTVE